MSIVKIYYYQILILFSFFLIFSYVSEYYIDSRIIKLAFS